MGRGAKLDLLFSFLPYSPNLVEVLFYEVRRSTARRGRWARYHEREAVGARQVKRDTRSGKSRYLLSIRGGLECMFCT